MTKVRKPAVAGFFYPSNKEELIKLIEWSFKHELGPGNLPSGEPTSERTIIAAQVPHAGYIYSGPAAAHVYSALYYDGKPETFVIMGPNHHGVGPGVSVYDGDAWETPLGVINIDKEFVKVLEKNKVFVLDDLAHANEHSIEVQLPFLQYIYGNNFEIVPISIWDQSLKTMVAVAEGLFNAALDVGKDIVFLASSDMSHYDTHDKTVEKDAKAIMQIEALDPDSLYKTIYNENVTMCGYGPVSVSMLLTRRLNGKAFTLKYYTSGDITGDKSAVVGYAAIIFTRSMGEFERKAGSEYEAVPI
ncbi:MAG: MEMO1 family protein [Candidatus Njordarchaeia archaeon]